MSENESGNSNIRNLLNQFMNKNTEGTLPGKSADSEKKKVRVLEDQPMPKVEHFSSSLTDTIFHQSGTIFTVQPKGNRGVDHDNLPPGNYSVKFDVRAGFYLEIISNFPPMGKIYGSTRQDADRILSTYRSKNGNLGVLLEGLKGSGKTLLAKLVSMEGAKLGIPTLIINSALTGEGFFQFLYSIQQQCIVLFDEFEKVYDDQDQKSLLTVLDGTFPSKKLFILTSNDKSKINSHLLNRPGRIHYYMKFKGLSGAFIKEYVADTLSNKDHEKELLSLCGLFSSLNFDSLSALVWEMNLYNEPAGKAIALLNAKPETENLKEFFDVEFQFKDSDVVFKENYLNSSTCSQNPLKLKDFYSGPLIPASPALAVKMMGLSEEEVRLLNPMGFEYTDMLISENKKQTEEKGTKVKMDWDDHDYVRNFAYESGSRIPLMSASGAEDTNTKFSYPAGMFNYSDLVSIGIEDRTFTYINSYGGTLRLKRREVKEDEASDLLKYCN